MNRQELVNLIKERQSYLCVGLDTDLHKIPRHLLSHPDPVFAFNKAIIDATKDLCVSYKINTAFYECMGIRGWESLQRTVEYIPSGLFTIADAKRGDIGNTSTQYAKTFFETYNFDAVTVAPYMGRDSVLPFLSFNEKWTILLGLTSNEGSQDFQLQQSGDEYLYEKVMKAGMSWGTPDNLMFVVGATQTSQLGYIRQLVPDHFFLVPGVGAQGGNLQDISAQAMNKDCGLLVNASRSIIYAGNGEDFANDARAAALQLQQEMAECLEAKQTLANS
ncbi:orotidine-5'-phosphate decarboxylase [Chitinophaga sp. CF418]|uniref:orotidine-5'-phosphate decarboxylase n=1 Tax=Chitinophaga sp. CF418 TaxID=1855287 RepID=UPI00090FD3EF|nr:orotidine-5'-phosphate decarboxylase [Chitinophaga sp. CF418]SHL89634.1 orotidine-5'-phosphate decarboxylase [Chitinophaga sp. CF418]